MKSIEDNWDQMAEAYEQFTGGEDSYSSRIEWPCIRRMLPNLDNLSVMDLGCGTGRFSFMLEHCGAKRVVGSDISANMLRIAKRQALACNSKVEFRKENVLHPTDEKFDLVFSSTVSHYVQNLEEFFAAVHFLLKQGGLCILSVMHPVYSAQYPIFRGDEFPEDSEWTVRYLDRRERGYIQPWIEYNDNIENFLSTSYHHTFSDYVNAIIRSGFSILEVQEPLPPEDWKKTCPGRYESFIETPSYLIFKLQRD